MVRMSSGLWQGGSVIRQRVVAGGMMTWMCCIYGTVVIGISWIPARKRPSWDFRRNDGKLNHLNCNATELEPDASGCGKFVIESEQAVEEGGDGMELFEPILGITMMVIGLIMVLGGMGLLFYAIWTNGSKKSQAGHAANNNVEVEPTSLAHWPLPASLLSSLV